MINHKTLLTITITSILTLSTLTPALAHTTKTLTPPTLTNPQTINLAPIKTPMTLQPNKDYILQLPKTTWTNPHGLHITGGRNIVIIGGTVNVAEGTPCTTVNNSCPPELKMKRAAYFKDQTGTIHLEGVMFHSNTGTLTEGINITAPQAKTDTKPADKI